MAERLQGGRLAARAIAAHGVDTIFTLSGGHVMPIYEGCRLEGVRVVDVRHEQAAAHAADGYARATGRVGVCVATSGPGATNLVTGLATAQMDSVPVVVDGFLAAAAARPSEFGLGPIELALRAV